MSDWKRISTAWLAFAEVHTDKSGDLYRATLTGPISDVSDNPHEAKKRLADRLARVVEELRR